MNGDGSVRHTTASSPPGRPDARGGSDVVGYVLVFALLLGTTVPILAVGTTVLEDRGNQVIATSGERSIAAFADEMAAIRRSESRGGAVVFHTGGGELTVTPTATVTVAQVDASGQRVGPHVTRRVGSVVYSHADTGSGYESGLRFRTDDTGTVGLDGPPIVSLGGSGDRTVVTILDMRPADGSASLTRMGTVRMRATVVDRRRIEFPAATVPSGELRLRIDSPRAATWANALRTVEGVTVNESATTPAAVVATFDSDITVSVRVVVVEVAADRGATGGHVHTMISGVADVQLNIGDGRVSI